MPKGVYDHHKIRGRKVENRRDYSGENNPNYRHGFAPNGHYHKLYMVWGDMVNRTNNPSHPRADSYVLRGITVCEEWKEFTAFKEWAIYSGYKPGLTIDRRDNDQGYCPDNCRWVTNTENCRNNSHTKISAEIATRIKQLRSSGLTYPFIADLCKCSKWVVQDVCRGRTWREC